MRQLCHEICGMKFKKSETEEEFDYRKDKKDHQTAMEVKDAGILSSFLETLEEKAALCGDKSKVMIETLCLLDENPSLRMINKLSNAAINLKHDLSGGKYAASYRFISKALDHRWKANIVCQ